MQIQVTQQHIEDGVPGDPHVCPVALAIRETIHKSHIKVVAYQFTIGYKPYFMPFSVRNFIDAYDSAKPVQPFSFVLDY